MIIFYSIKNEGRKDIWVGQTLCPKCGQTSNWHLYKMVFRISIFFIPFAAFTLKRFLVCEQCSSAKKMKLSEYNKIKKEQMQKLKSGNFPADIILRDYNPKELKFGKKILVLLVTAFWTLLMIMILAESGALGLLSGVIFLVICVLPLVFSIRNFIDAVFKKKAYAAATRGK